MTNTRTPPLFTRPMMILAGIALAGILAVSYLQAERHQAGVDKEATAAHALLMRKRASEEPEVIASNRNATALELLQAESIEEVDPKAKKIRSMEEILLNQASLDNEAEEGFLREDKQRAEAVEAAKQAAEPSDTQAQAQEPSVPVTPATGESGPEKEEVSPEKAPEAVPAEASTSPEIPEANAVQKSDESPALAITPDAGAPAASQEEPAPSPAVLESGQSL